MRIGLHYCRQAKIKGIEYLNFFEFLVIMSLLLMSGIERNPGPAPSASFYSDSSENDQVIRDKFSVVHYNIQSITKKLE